MNKSTSTYGVLKYVIQITSLTKCKMGIVNQNGKTRWEFPFKLGIPTQFGKWESKWELKSKKGNCKTRWEF